MFAGPAIAEATPTRTSRIERFRNVFTVVNAILSHPTYRTKNVKAMYRSQSIFARTISDNVPAGFAGIILIYGGKFVADLAANLFWRCLVNFCLILCNSKGKHHRYMPDPPPIPLPLSFSPRNSQRNQFKSRAVTEPRHARTKRLCFLIYR